jgi:hypothetical protein
MGDKPLIKTMESVPVTVQVLERGDAVHEACAPFVLRCADRGPPELS